MWWHVEYGTAANGHTAMLAVEAATISEAEPLAAQACDAQNATWWKITGLWDDRTHGRLAIFGRH